MLIFVRFQLKGVVYMLTELAIKNAKTRETSYMIRDERGLYLRIDSSGAKYWILSTGYSDIGKIKKNIKYLLAYIRIYHLKKLVQKVKKYRQ